MPSTMATYVYASSQGQRTHSARTKSIGFWIINPRHTINIHLSHVYFIAQNLNAGKNLPAHQHSKW